MIRILVLAVLFSMLFAVMLGCSQSAPVAPDLTPDRVIGMDGRVLWGYYQLHIDPSVPSVEVVPAREALKHFNVKLFLNPPNCSDCITIAPVGPYVDNILPVNITLKNPEPIGGFDVRGILLSDDEGADLNNPDNYTALFDNGGPVSINPFKAFAAMEVNRKFKAGASHTEKYDIYLSSFGKVTVIDYAVDASWPTRAKEPFQINEPVLDGEIDSFGINEVEITVDVFAAGDDVDEVWFDLSSLGVAEEQALEYVSGNTWKSSYQNLAGLGVGEYICACRASTSSSTGYLYSYFTLAVVQGVISLADDVQPIFDEYCIACHTEPGAPLTLDLTEGNTYANTVEVDAVQSFMKRVSSEALAASYLWAKITGNHEGFPFVGSGGRMPLNGPPYLTESEIITIEYWIISGALDN